MRFCVPTLLSLVLATSSLATPTRRINSLQDVLLFDAPAFQDPKFPGKTLVSLQTFVSIRQFDIPILNNGVAKALAALGVDVGDKIAQVMERIKLFGAIGLPGQDVEVVVDGCDSKARIAGTSGLPDLGMALRNISLGTCRNGVQPAQLTAVATADDRKFSAKIFASPPSGFGVISDIDDTVKVSNVLDKIKLAQATFIDEPEAVKGMPELYASLAQKLNSPIFIYITGSPFQLYPFLRKFIDTAYSQANGPIMLQNFTLVDIPGILNFASGNGVFEYKSAMIDRVKGMYPNKKFVAIGDSTQKDPETYAEAFRKYKNFITCIIIRKVPGADNNATRFSTAFKGVPSANFRLVDDSQIPGLTSLDPASGKC